MRRALALSTMLIVVLLALAACGGDKPEPTAGPAAAQPATVTQAAAQTKPTAAAGATAARAPVPTAVPAATTAAVEEALPVLKPGALKSYVARMELKSEVVRPEAAIENWSEMKMTYRLDPAPVAYAMVIEDKSEEGRPDMQMIVIGEATYFKPPDEEQWTKLPTGAGLSSMMQTLLDPEELTKEAPVDIFTAANVVKRNETVDGVATTHYRATEAQLRALMKQNEAITQQKQTLLSGTADFWVAKQGNYLKQYRVETLQEDETGRQVKNVMQLQVTQENQPVTIEPPPADQVTEMPAFDRETPEPEPTSETAAPEASAELARLPAPPESEEYQPADLSGAAKFLVETMAAQAPVRAFLSKASPEDVDKFYEAEMPKLGYRSAMQQAGELGIAINLFMKGDQSVMIQINQDPESGKTLVTMQMP